MAGHAFLSYVREDAAAVERLARALEDAGVETWRDVDDIAPGGLWRPAVTDAIEEGCLAFVAALSSTGVADHRSGQHAEMALALERLRKRLEEQPEDDGSAPWFLAVRLDDCDPGRMALADVEALTARQYIDLFDGRWDEGCARLVDAVRAVLLPEVGPVTAWGWLPEQAILRGAATGRRWPLAPRTHPRALTGHPGPVTDVCAVPAEGGAALAATGRPFVRIWDAVSGEPVHEADDGRLGWVGATCAAPVEGRLLVATVGDTLHRLRLWDPATGRQEGEAFGPTTDQTSLCTVPVGGDRVLLATGGHMDDDAVHLWDPVARSRVGAPLTGHGALVTSVCAVPVGDRTLVASASQDATVRLWDPLRGEPFGQGAWRGGAHADGGAYGLCVVPVGGRATIAAGCGDGRIRLWDALDGRPVGDALWGHDGPVLAVCAFPAGDRMLVASAGHGGVVRLWEPGSGRLREPFARHGAGVASLCAVPVGAGMVLASGGFDGAVRLWAVRGDGVPEAAESLSPPARPATPHRPVARWQDDGGATAGVCPVPVAGGRVLVATGLRKAVRFWDTATGAAHGEPIEAHHGGIGALCGLVVDGRHLVASADTPTGRPGEPCTIRLWAPEPAVAVGNRIVTDGIVHLCAVPDAGRMLLAAIDVDFGIVAWDATTGEPQGHGWEAAGKVASLSAVAVGGVDALASVTRDGLVELWPASGGGRIGPRFRRSRLRRGSGREVRASCTIVVRGRPYLATGDAHGTVTVWDVATGRPAAELRGHTDDVMALCAVPLGDDVALASASWDGTVRLWEVTSGRPIGAPLVGHDGPVRAVAAVAVGGAPAVVTGGVDGAVCLWAVGAPSSGGTAPPARRVTTIERTAAEVGQAGGRAHLRGDIVAWLEAFGRSKAAPGEPGMDAMVPTVIAVHRVWAANPEGFVTELAAVTLPEAGWAAYGAHKLADEVLTERPRTAADEALFTAAMRLASHHRIPLTFGESGRLHGG